MAAAKKKARKPSAAKHCIWWRQLTDSSGQPCTNTISGASFAPLER